MSDDIVNTIRGPMHARELRKVVVRNEDERSLSVATEWYTFTGELVKRSAKVMPKGLTVISKFGS